jgi:hypothetical protein
MLYYNYSDIFINYISKLCTYMCRLQLRRKMRKLRQKSFKGLTRKLNYTHISKLQLRRYIRKIQLCQGILKAVSLYR